MATKSYSPIILEKLDLQVNGHALQEFALHRHHDETTRVDTHSHGFDQLIFYLAGHGHQIIEQETTLVYPGTLAAIPAQCEHSFRKNYRRRPYCLVINFRAQLELKKNAHMGRMTSAEIAKIKRLVAKIAQVKGKEQLDVSITLCAIILEIFAILISGSGWSLDSHANASSPLQNKLEKIFRRPENRQLTLKEVAQKAGYQQDYLNRVLKTQTGLTLKDLRDENALLQAQSLLLKNSTISETTFALGFNDPNYFSRWFKKQTGQTPNSWKKFYSQEASKS